jgi:hypothetical protein
MATAAYDYDVDSEALLDEEETKTQPKAGTRGPSVSVSPSPFHVPVGVTIHITRGGDCAIGFAYPNEERPDRTLHRIPGDTETAVHVGKYTRKILRLHFANAIERFRRGRLQFDLVRGAREWSADLPSAAQPSAIRNARIIEGLLAKMPDSIHADILTHLKQHASHPG